MLPPPLVGQIWATPHETILERDIVHTYKTKSLYVLLHENIIHIFGGTEDTSKGFVNILQIGYIINTNKTPKFKHLSETA